jgi:asparagine synthase (glutamine-hydrolysing)
MCGIAGYINKHNAGNGAVLKEMLDALAHRGPDNSGCWSSDNQNVFLGHRRLSILDLSDSASQPMLDEKKELVITYNGEIYNFNEIKNELIESGYSFKTSSDTEMILYAFKEWGVAAVSKFIGMFAIVIYDMVKNELYFIRDRFGVKPLFLYEDQDKWMFSSEIKSFFKHPDFNAEINTDAIPLFLKYGYVPTPYSIFKNVRKVKPGHIVKLDLTNNKIVDDSSYWDAIAAFNQPKFEDKSEETIIAEVEELLKSAFQYRMVADVPVGVFLSGGIDSSLVTAVLTQKLGYKLKTFTIGFDQVEFNEAKVAKEISSFLGTEHNEYICSEKDALEIIPRLPFYYDEPFADSSAIPTYLLSQKVRSHVTVALSADGGDEIFGGYTKYFSQQKFYNIIRKMPAILAYPLSLGISVLRKYKRLKGNLDRDVILERAQEILATKEKEHVYLKKIDSRLFSNYEIDKLLTTKHHALKTEFEARNHLSASNTEIEKMQATDIKTYMLDDILVKVDRATMANGLEGREPLLDHRLLEYVARIPAGIKFKNNIGKYLLKEIDYKIIPKELLDRPKTGFAIPVKKWLLNELSVFYNEYLSKAAIAQSGIFNYEEIAHLVERFQKTKGKVDAEKIWRILSFQMWYRYWITNRTS